MIVLRWLRRLSIALVLLVTAVALGARFHDGPLGPFPGGALARGPLVTQPVTDWTFAASIPEIELQLEKQDRSRTVWVLVHQGQAFVPAATAFPPGKSWHRTALEDGRATLRIDGKRYPVTLAKVEDETLTAAVREVAGRKYGAGPGGEIWLFSVASR
jgi:hypothetical protein